MAETLDAILSAVSRIEQQLSTREELEATKPQLAIQDSERLRNVMQTEQLFRAAYLPNVHEPLVIRQSNEEFHLDCINSEPAEPTTSDDTELYFAHFSGLTGKGPLIAWSHEADRKFGLLSPENHYKAIFLGFSKWMDNQTSESLFAVRPDMCAHATVAVKDELQGRSMPIEHFPPASPDLNPITVMFNLIETNLKIDKDNSLFGEVAEWRIRQLVRTTWHNISRVHARARQEHASTVPGYN
ncbi:hypothetical protein IL306_006811 [Fusarium sp. DS 682]|nr:hypothetical protein IL306_006811 [Fusarium sp. DS 682]